MPNGAPGGSTTARADEPASAECPAHAPIEWPRWPLASLASAARALSERPNAKACMKPSRASITLGGPRQANCDFVTGDDCLDQLRAADGALVTHAERGRHHRAAAMRRADPVAVVELDAVRRRAAEESRIEQVVALGAARHRDGAAAAHTFEHFLGIGRDIA